MKIRLMILDILIILFFSNNIFAGWTRTYGGSGSESGMSVCQTIDGGYIVVATTRPYRTPSDVWLIKTDANGDTSWTKTFGGMQDDGGISVQQTTDGGYIIVGGTFSYGTGYYGAGTSDVWLIKTDANGDTSWTKTFGDSHNDYGSSVQQTTDGGYIIVGETSSFGAADNVWLVKTDTNGDTSWTRSYGTHKIDIGESVYQTIDGGYIVVGYTRSYGAGSIDVWLIKTDANGDTLWTRTFGGEFGDTGYSAQQTADQGYIIVGSTSSYGAGESDVWLIKTDANGDTSWTKTFGGSGVDAGEFVQQTTDGGYIITGRTDSYGAGSKNVWLIKTDENGNIEE